MAHGNDDDRAFLAGHHDAWIKSLLEDVGEIKGDVKEIRKEHERRIRSLERWRAALVASMAALFGIKLS